MDVLSADQSVFQPGSVLRSASLHWCCRFALGSPNSKAASLQKGPCLVVLTGLPCLRISLSAKVAASSLSRLLRLGVGSGFRARMLAHIPSIASICGPRSAAKCGSSSGSLSTLTRICLSDFWMRNNASRESLFCLTRWIASRMRAVSRSASACSTSSRTAGVLPTMERMRSSLGDCLTAPPALSA